MDETKAGTCRHSIHKSFKKVLDPGFRDVAHSGLIGFKLCSEFCKKGISCTFGRLSINIFIVFCYLSKLVTDIRILYSQEFSISPSLIKVGISIFTPNLLEFSGDDLSLPRVIAFSFLENHD